jgi:hypothetical protein
MNILIQRRGAVASLKAEVGLIHDLPFPGSIAWILIAFGVVSTLVVEAHDRKVLERGELKLTLRPGNHG